MSTIGHPLSDLSNLLFPYVASTSNLYGRSNPAFSPSATTPGLPTRTECINWYAEVAGWDPSQEQGWGDAFGCFRNSVIMQGIAARYALRQASSAKAKDYGVQMRPFAEFAWSLIEMLKGSGSGLKAKL